MNKVIAMAANQNYLSQLSTTIKSLLYNNSHLKIYILNSDIPQEWFIGINSFINSIGSKIIDIKIDPISLKNEFSPKVNVISYAKFLVPKYITAKRAIWIDSDMIIDGSINELFTKDMGNNDVAAVKEIAADDYNSGLIVFNLTKLHKSPDVSMKLLSSGQNSQNNNGDQSVFNNFFQNSIQELPMKYNFQVGHGHNTNTADKNKIVMNTKSAIIYHYLTNDKPWHLTSWSRNREKWWRYYNLEWLQIVDKYRHIMSYTPRELYFVGKTYTVTADQNIAHIEQIINKMPQWQFNIAAYTAMGFNLLKLLQYPNVRLFPNVIEYNRKKLMNNCDIYLDINYGPKNNDIISKWHQTGKPILTFDSVAANIKDCPEKSFALDDIDGMIQAIQSCKK